MVILVVMAFAMFAEKVTAATEFPSFLINLLNKFH